MGQKISYHLQRQIIDEDLSHLGIEYCYPLSRNLVIRHSEITRDDRNTHLSSSDDDDDQCSFACCKVQADLLPSAEQEKDDDDDSDCGREGELKPTSVHHDDDDIVKTVGGSGEKLVAVKTIPKSATVFADRRRRRRMSKERRSSREERSDQHQHQEDHEDGDDDRKEKFREMDEQLKLSVFYTLCQLYNIPEQLIVRIMDEDGNGGGSGDSVDDGESIASEDQTKSSSNRDVSQRKAMHIPSQTIVVDEEERVEILAGGVVSKNVIASDDDDDDDDRDISYTANTEQEVDSDSDSYSDLDDDDDDDDDDDLENDDAKTDTNILKPTSIDAKKEQRKRSFSTAQTMRSAWNIHTSTPPAPILRTSSFDSSTGSYLNRPSDIMAHKFNDSVIVSPPSSVGSDRARALFSIISPKKSNTPTMIHNNRNGSFAQRELDFTSSVDSLVFSKRPMKEEPIEGYMDCESPSQLSSSLVVNKDTVDRGQFARKNVGLKRTQLPMNGVFPPKHANIPLLYGCYESDNAFYIILDYHELSVEDLIKFNRSILVNNEIKRRFTFYQILQSVFFCHKSGFAHGKIEPSTILVNDMLWVYLTSLDTLYAPNLQDNNCGGNRSGVTNFQQQQQQPTRNREKKKLFTDERRSALRITGTRPSAFDMEMCIFSSRSRFSSGEKVIVPRSKGSMTYADIIAEVTDGLWRVICHDSGMRRQVTKDLHTAAIGKLPNLPSVSVKGKTLAQYDGMQAATVRWQKRELSNFDYLMVINTHVGRRLGDHQYHPVFPWVIDFKTATSWRDLTKSKYRLTKGDEMLDMTFNGRTPHHITEPLSEITYFSYLARCTPVDLLTKFVRPKFVPEEYPPSVERIYAWTPDECIPEFYTDPAIVNSIHTDMCDLQLPSWAANAEDFILKHRAALESDHVSSQLHHWIDIVFGYKLSGRPAIEAKNVVLQRDDLLGIDIPARRGFYQIFHWPHPPRNASEWCNMKSQDNSPQMQRKQSRSRPNTSQSDLFDNISLLTSFEQTVSFSRAHFSRAEYHIIPLISSGGRSGSKRKFTQQDLYLDDMFALGCLLAELYTFTPLFTSQTLNLYIKGKYTPHLGHIMQPVREVVSMLISLDASQRKKALRSHNGRMLFPSYFKFVYHFLSRFYKLPTFQQRYVYAIQMEHKLIDLPEEAFELAFQHVLHMFLGSKSLWIEAVQLICGRLFAVRIRRMGHCELIKAQFQPYLHDMYAETDNEPLQMQLLSYTMARIAKSIVADKKTFLEKIVPFFIEGLNSRFPQVAMMASNTLLKLAESDLGIILTLQHLVEPMLERISRLYILSLSISGTTNSSKRDTELQNIINEPHQYVTRTLVKLALSYDPTNMISYYIPKFLHIILQGIKFTKRKQEQKKRQNSGISLTHGEEEEQHPKANNFDIYAIFYQLLAAVDNESSSINYMLLNNESILVTIFESYEFLSVYTFDKLCCLLRHLLLICDVDVRLQMIQAISPALKNIFHSEIVWDIQLTSGVLLSSASLGDSAQTDLSNQKKVRQHDGTYLGNTNETSMDTALIEEQVDSIAQEQNLDNVQTDLRTPNVAKRSRRATLKSGGRTTLKSLVDKFKSFRAPLASQAFMEHEEEYNRGEKSALSSTSSSTSPTRSPTTSPNHMDSMPQSSQNERSTFDSNFNFDEIQMRKACIMYRELCRIVGNSHAQSAVQNSHIFEERISEIQVSTDHGGPTEMDRSNTLFENASWHGDDEDYVEDYIPSSLRDSLSQSKSSRSWILSSNSRTIHNICQPSDDAFYLDFRGNFETQLRSSSQSHLNTLDVLPSDERIFITGDARSMVQIWNLEIGKPTLGMSHHVGQHRTMKNGVTKVKFLDFRRGTTVASCDGSTIHLWDTETRKTKTFIGGTGSNVQFLTFEQSNTDSNMLITTTDQSTIKFFDLRTNRECFEWRVWHDRNIASQPQSRPQLRSITCSDPTDHYIAVGSSNGMVSLLEQHSGFIINSFKAHNGDVTRMLPFANGLFFSMSNEHQVFRPLSNATTNPPASLRLWDTSHFPSECVKFYTPPTKDDPAIVTRGLLPTPRAPKTYRASMQISNPQHQHYRRASAANDEIGNVIGLVGSTNTGIMTTTSITGSGTNTTSQSSELHNFNSITSSSQQFQSFVDIDVNMDLEQMFVVTHSTICHVANFVQLTDASTFPIGSEHCTFSSVYRYKNSPGNFFTGAKLLPLHKMLLVTSQDGSINLFS